MVFSFEIEARLVEHPKVLEAAVVGREDPSGLIKPEAHVVLNDPENQSEDLSGELLEHCKSGLAPINIHVGFNSSKNFQKLQPGRSSVSSCATEFAKHRCLLKS